MSIVSQPFYLCDLADTPETILSFADRLYQRGLRLTKGDPCLTNDLVQFTLMKAVQVNERFDDEISFYRWSFHTLKNAYINHHRTIDRHSVERTYEGRRSSGRLRQIVVEQEEEKTDTLSDDRILAALIALSSVNRSILEKISEEKSYAQVAEELGISESSVRARLFHTRQKLRPRLAEVYREYTGHRYTSPK